MCLHLPSGSFVLLVALMLSHQQKRLRGAERSPKRCTTAALCRDAATDATHVTKAGPSAHRPDGGSSRWITQWSACSTRPATTSSWLPGERSGDSCAAP